MNKSTLLKKLRGKKTFKQKAKVFDEFIEEASSDDLKNLRDFYDASVITIQKCRGVTRARSMLQNDGHMDYFGGLGSRYSTLHQLASYVKSNRKEIRMPDDELKKDNGERIKRYNNTPTRARSQGLCKLNHVKPSKVKTEKRPYGNI